MNDDELGNEDDDPISTSPFFDERKGVDIMLKLVEPSTTNP